SLSARRRMSIATSAVLIVGVIVAGLAGLEIRRNLIQMATAHASSAESRDYLQSLLDGLVSGVVVIGQDGVVQTVSESFRQLPLVGPDAHRDQHYTDLFHKSLPLLA